MCGICNATILDMGHLSFIFETRYDDAGDIGWPQLGKDIVPNKIRHGKPFPTMTMSRALCAMHARASRSIGLVLGPHGWNTTSHNTANRSSVPS